jgi:signal transduction histidine kinase
MYEFIAHLAHDVRAPLGAIRMWTHVLRGSDDAGDKLAGLNAIDASVRAHSEMMTTLVDVSRAIVGRLPLDRRLIRLLPHLNDAIQATAPDAKLRDVALDPPQVSPLAAEPALLAEPARLTHLLTAIVSFSVSNAPKGGAVSTRVSVGVPGIELRVSTAGTSLSAQDLAGLFTPYHSGGVGEPRRDFGLGLPFARALALLHGGTLDAEGGGAGQDLAFRLCLPEAPNPPK